MQDNNPSKPKFEKESYLEGIYPSLVFSDEDRETIYDPNARFTLGSLRFFARPTIYDFESTSPHDTNDNSYNQHFYTELEEPIIQNETRALIFARDFDIPLDEDRIALAKPEPSSEIRIVKEEVTSYVIHVDFKPARSLRIVRD